jgi:2-oxo-4-hydroxy-4-carboxy-5-ureidoimidazoline decarboxylase
MSDPAETYSRERFVERFGGVYEHSPWVAEQCFAAAKKVPQSEYVELFARCVDAADHATKHLLIQAHPDLAGRAAVRGELTAESTNEQASAGIDQCTDEEYAQFVAFNAAYKEKFGFPFIMAVKNSNRHEILAAFSKRIENDADTEFETAIREIHKIARLRLEVMNKDGR